VESKPFRSPTISPIVGTALLLLLAAVVATLLLKSPGSFGGKVKLLFALLGLYGLALAFLRHLSTAANVRDVIEGLTSRDIGRYVTANLLFVSLIPLAARAASARPRSTGGDRVLALAGRALWIPVGLALALYILLYLLIIAPLAYPAWILADALLAALDASSEADGASGGSVWVRDVVFSDRVRAKALIVGAAALVLWLAADVVGMLV
jgi:hypothetical protein